MTVFLAIIVAVNIALMVHAIVLVYKATAVMADVAKSAREASDLAAAIKSKNDAMRERFNDGWAVTKEVDGGFICAPKTKVRIAIDGDASQQRYVNRGNGPLWFG